MPRASSTARSSTKMGELGILGLPIPEEYGGSGFDYVSLALACEELEYVDTFLRVVMSVHVGLNSLALLQWATEEQKQRWLTPQAHGEKLGTFGLTEPNAGSDAGSIEIDRRPRRRLLRPQRRQDVDLAGRRRRSLPRLRQHRPLARSTTGLTAFMLERGMAGFTTGTIKGKLGVRAGNTGELAFNNVRVPVENRIGEEGEGFKIAMSCIDQGRFTVGAGAVGLIRACLDASVKYANERDDFGAGDRQVPAGPADDRQDGGRLRGLPPADDEGRRAEEPRHPQHPRDLADEVVRLRRRRCKSADDAIQIHGSYGYSNEYPVERFWRNARGAVIYEGTREIHTILQAEYALGYRQDKPLRCPQPPAAGFAELSRGRAGRRIMRSSIGAINGDRPTRSPKVVRLQTGGPKEDNGNRPTSPGTSPSSSAVPAPRSASSTARSRPRARSSSARSSSGRRSSGRVSIRARSITSSWARCCRAAPVRTRPGRRRSGPGWPGR